jgi:5'-nucleotidase
MRAQRHRSRVPIHRSAKCLIALVAVVLASCSGSDTDASPTSTQAAVPATTSAATDPAPTTTPNTVAPTIVPSTTEVERPLQVLVTNDDGVGADGIDAVVEALRTLDGVEVTVVAPASQQSGTGGNTTDGPVSAVETTTASGFSAVAVEGFPTDAIVWAIDEGGIDVEPDLVVSGINEGQNLGPFVDLSGTIGAARAAVERGIPSIAISQGLSAADGTPPDFAAGAEALLAYLAEHIDLLVDESPSRVVNINVPTCEEGSVIRGVVEGRRPPVGVRRRGSRR